ncbi:MAG TPA: ABC transporter substrate-binding protein [Mycobacteriales bacterium]|jgi:ABC-type branched-subunit amino acid transport system substrate-binding protein|nr:ABC transporter substrate-binding protein [Mycobacteriales bacterium]
MKRNHAGAAAFVLASMLALSACGGGGSSGGGGASSDTVSVGLLAPLTGALAGVGTGYKLGLQAAFDEANAGGGVLNGKKLTITTVDESPTDSSVSTQAMRKFASGGSKIVVGAALSQDCIASAPVAQQLKILNISPGCGVAKLIGPNRLSKTFFSSAGNDAMQAYGLSKTLTEKFPNVTTLYSVNYDYVTGREVSGAIRKSFQETLKVGGNDYFVPLNAVDYGATVSALAAKATGTAATQGLILTNYGSGALAFLKQAGQAGLLDRFAFIGTAYQFYAPAVAFKGASPKVWDAYVYVHHDIHDNAANTKFVAEYRKLSSGAYPNDWGFSGYITGLAIVQALKKANSDDVTALNTALEGMTIDGPTGSFTIDANTHHFQMPEVVGEIGGDPAATEGVKLYDSEVIPGAEANSKPLG